jgi:DNA-binding CsgD family transcriptional regulator
VRTLDFHLENLRGKFGAASMLHLAVRLVRTGAG